MKLMLAGKAPSDLAQVRYPVICSPKLDGIRAYIDNGVVMSRNEKPIPNALVQAQFGKAIFNGLDGELIVGRPTDADCFRKTTSVVMSDAQVHDQVTFHAFDMVPSVEDGATFAMRLQYVDKLLRNRHDAGWRVVAHLRVDAAAHLEMCEKVALEDGYEGLMLRDPLGLYKHGRSTTKEGGLLKLKRFEDSEATIIGVEEEMHNANEKGVDGKRTSHKAGKVGKGTLGAVKVRDHKTRQTFSVGSGFTASERASLWKKHKSLAGQVIKYKYFPSGGKDAPRFPTFLGFRSDV